MAGSNDYPIYVWRFGVRSYEPDAWGLVTGETVCTGITEWVYIDRKTLAPKAIPPVLATEFHTPGKPLQAYDPPVLQPTARLCSLVQERTVEWHEIDSIGHVNNAVYADW